MHIGNTHLVCGDAGVLDILCAKLAKEDIQTSGPDAYVRVYQQFGVEEARELIARAEMRPISAAFRVFVLAMPSMTVEAQNALLKTLEEPPADAMFFFILPSPEMLLSTLRSRSQYFAVSAVHTNEVDTLVNAKSFLAAGGRERVEMLKPILEKNEDDKHDMNAIFTFLSSLERALGECGATSALESIYRARKYMADKGSLKKTLLEQVALLVPRV